jgi:CheY-like chemotaxis protein
MTKVMLAEDDPTMVSLLKTLLRLEGLDSVELSPDEDVLNAVARENPSVLMLDVHLAQGNGLDFLREMRADPRFSKLYVLMASGMDLRDECLAAGANAFLLKPFMPDVLISAIKIGMQERSRA